MLKQGFLTLAFLLVAGGVYAESDAIAKRQAIYKSYGAASRPIADMLKGATPFDAAVAKASFTTMADGAKKLPDLFPEDSKEGGKTQALPIIWTEKDKFNALMSKFEADATAAATGVTDEASLKTLAPKVLGNCKACHDVYRAKS